MKQTQTHTLSNQCRNVESVDSHGVPCNRQCHAVNNNGKELDVYDKLELHPDQTQSQMQAVATTSTSETLPDIPVTVIRRNIAKRMFGIWLSDLGYDIRADRLFLLLLSITTTMRYHGECVTMVNHVFSILFSHEASVISWEDSI